MVTMPKDLTGKRFGLLLVIGQAGKNKHGQPKWLCQCDCGKTKVVKHEVLVKSANNSSQSNKILILSRKKLLNLALLNQV